MSAVFIVIYAGWPIRFPWLDLTSRERASQFISEGDAWFEVYRAHLNPRHCRVEGFDEAAEQQLRPTEGREVSTGSKVSS